MTHPKHLSIHDFTYDLPEDRVARYPLAERDASRLLIYNNGIITESHYKEIAGLLPADSLLIFNNTRVVAARLLFQKPTGARIEIFCLEPHPRYSNITTAMARQGSVVWLCLIGGASKWKKGQILEKKIEWEGKEGSLQARYLEKEKDSFAVELSWEPAGLSFAEVLHHAGMMPLPPYMHREAEAADDERYQTIYAHTEGSVAAPTAGLHFTDAIFDQLSNRHIQRSFVTLHVGAGTFRPVKSDTMEDHDMHAEFIDVERSTIETIIRYLDKHITLVGTTSLRTVESLYWMGCKVLQHPGATPEELAVKQWEAYKKYRDPSVPAKFPGHTPTQAEHDTLYNASRNSSNMPLPTPEKSLQALLHWMQKNKLERLITKTQLLIAPGYSMKIAHALVTNFHQPQSTLLLLVAAFIGNDWHKVYDYALQRGFRFLSYGDGCLLFRQAAASSGAIQ